VEATGDAQGRAVAEVAEVDGRDVDVEPASLQGHLAFTLRLLLVLSVGLPS
jgi:hypothetical protein